MLQVEHDGRLEGNFLDITTTVALSVGAIDLLRNEEFGVLEPRGNVENVGYGLGRTMTHELLGHNRRDRWTVHEGRR